MSKTGFIDIVFDGPPSHESGRFVEVEDSEKCSINIGEWVQDEGFWRLRIADPRLIAQLEAELTEAQTEISEQAAIIGKSIDESDKFAMEKRAVEVDQDRLVASLEFERTVRKKAEEATRVAEERHQAARKVAAREAHNHCEASDRAERAEGIIEAAKRMAQEVMF